MSRLSAISDLRKSASGKIPYLYSALGLFALFVISGCVFERPLLNAAARFLVTSDPLQHADLMFLLGGNYSVRAPAAAALLREGWAPKILLAREPNPARNREGFTDITERILLQHGVARERILVISPADGVRSTADEAHALRLFLETYPRSNVLVVTSAFHTRRARLALSRAVPAHVQIRMFAVQDPDCPTNAWPTSPYCRHQVEMEWTKLAYYFFTFFG